MLRSPSVHSPSSPPSHHISPSRRKFIPPPPSFHSPQPHVPLYQGRSTQGSPGSTLSQSRSIKYPPSASQSHKILGSAQKQASSSRQRSGSIASSTGPSRIQRSSSRISNHASPRSPGSAAQQSSLASARFGGAGSPGSPAVTRHRRSSSSASATAAAYALTRTLRSRFQRTDSHGNNYYESDESWDDGELDPNSEYALPEWKLGMSGQKGGNTKVVFSNASPLTPPKEPLIHEASLRDWTSDVETGDSDASPLKKSRTIVRKFSNNFSPEARGSPKKAAATLGPRSPFKLARNHSDGPGLTASSTGRGAPLLLSSRPAHVKQSSSLNLAQAEGSPKPNPGALLPAFATPPPRSIVLFDSDDGAEEEEELRDDADEWGHLTNERTSKSDKLLQAHSFRPLTTKVGSQGLQKQKSSPSLKKQRSFGSLSANDKTPQPNHQNVELKTVRPCARHSSPRAMSFPQFADIPIAKAAESRDLLFSSTIEDNPKLKKTAPQPKTSVSISSIRNALASATANARNNLRQQPEYNAQAVPTGLKTTVLRDLAPPSRPTTPPPFSDLISMPPPTVKQSKAERLLGLSAGAAAAIQASSNTGTKSSQPDQPRSLERLQPMPSLTGAYSAHPYARVRSPYELLPRSATPVALVSSTASKDKISAVNKLLPGGFQGIGPQRPSRPVDLITENTDSKALASALPLLSYDPSRRPRTESPASASSDNLQNLEKPSESSPVSGSDSSEGKTTVGEGRSLPQALRLNSAALMRKLNSKRFNTYSIQVKEADQHSRGADPIFTKMEQESRVPVGGAGNSAKPTATHLLPSPFLVSSHAQRSPLLAALDAEAQLTAEASTTTPRVARHGGTLLPPLPARKAQPHCMLPPNPCPSQPLPPTPVPKDPWRHHKSNVAAAALPTPALVAGPEALTSEVLRASKASPPTGGVSIDSLYIANDSRRTSAYIQSEARPSSPEIDVLPNQTDSDTASSSEDQQADSDVEHLVELPRQEARGTSQSNLPARPTTPFTASILGTRLVPTSELEKHTVLDNGLGLRACRRTVVELKVREDTFWVMEDVIASSTQHESGARLPALVTNTGKMAAAIFGPDPAISENTADAIAAAVPDKPTSSTATPLVTPATAKASNAFEFGLQQYPSSQSMTTLADALTPRTAVAPATVDSPSDAELLALQSCNLASAHPVTHARASNTSTFARALGPLVAQQAAYIARLRMQQQQDDTAAHVLDTPWSTVGGAFEPISGDDEITLDGVTLDLRHSGSTVASSWLRCHSSGSELIPSRHPSQLLRDDELELSDADVAAAAPQDEAITPSQSPVASEVMDHSKVDAQERTHILITVKIDRDPMLYPAILAKLCARSRAAVNAEEAGKDTPETDDSDWSAGSETHSKGPSTGNLRASVLLQPVNVGTISRRRRRGTGARGGVSGASTDSQAVAAAISGSIAKIEWTTGAEAEEAAWLGL